MKFASLVCILSVATTVEVWSQDYGDLFAAKRAEVLAEYDLNKNGRLDSNERLKIWRSKSEEMNNGGSTQRRRQPRPHPPELLAKYDKDQSGWIDGSEWDVAGPTESAIIRDKYDKNANEKLEDEEKVKLWEDIQSGKLKGLYGDIARYFLLRDEDDEKSPAYIERQRALLKFDSDGDGLASNSELAAIRAAIKATQSANKNDR